MLSFWEIANVIVPPTRFQMVSLLKLAKVTEEGVRFLSPHDGTPMYVRLISPSWPNPVLLRERERKGFSPQSIQSLCKTLSVQTSLCN